MTGSEQRSFQARKDQLQLALGFVEAVCERHGVAPTDTLRLTLIVEELFTNTIVHGHRGEAEAPVRIEVRVEPARLVLRFEDNAPAFDPLRYLQDAPLRLDAHVDERQVGGLGLPLVAQLAEQFDYVHVDGFNRLYLVLQRGG